MSRQETEEILQRLVDHLRKQKLPFAQEKNVPLAWAAQAADAIDRYLAGKVNSLDAAFGLTPKRGAPSKDEKHIAIAREIVEMRLNGDSWIEIAQTFSTKNNSVSDERTLRRIFHKYFAALIVDHPKLSIKLAEILDSRPDSKSGA